jgi:hypothetical protein
MSNASHLSQVAFDAACDKSMDPEDRQAYATLAADAYAKIA